jgi:bifunctional DNA-binding transcriptional regulator/antitoxin component of YhaV-PrlF toxin-antitoxin module
MIVQTEHYNFEFTLSLDDRNRVTIPIEIIQLIGTKKGDKITLVLKKAHTLQKE